MRQDRGYSADDERETDELLLSTLVQCAQSKRDEIATETDEQREFRIREHAKWIERANL